jgi:hypothetical protein
MKQRIYLVLFCFLFCFSTYGLDNNENRAKILADKMTKLLSLDDKTSKKVYSIQLNKINAEKNISLVYKDDLKLMKSEQLKIDDRLRKNLIRLIGESNYNSWISHKKSI